MTLTIMSVVMSASAIAAGGSLWATALQRIVVAPNEQVRETPYIVHNIAATRKA